MSDAYGICRWTCGECGEVFEFSGVVGDSKLMRARSDHKDEHRFEKMSPEQQANELRRQAEAMGRSLEWRLRGS